MSDLFENYWVEKYRPKTFDDIVLPDNIRAQFLKFQKEGTFPHLLFVGHHGIGKTSLSKIIVNDLFELEYLYINASDENGIDVVRTKIIDFANVRPLDGKFNVVILDECDGLTDAAQRALRNVMEEMSTNTRFILTANYKHRIIPALQSRTAAFDLTPNLKQYASRILNILNSEGVDSKPCMEELKLLIKATYPDFRKAIQTLNTNTENKTLNLVGVKVDNSLANQIIDRIIRKEHYQDIRKFIIASEEQFNGDYPSLLKEIFNYLLEDNEIDYNKKIAMISIVGEHHFRCASVMDQEINMFHCIISLIKNFNS